MSSTHGHKIFVSYAHEDKATARRLYSLLSEAGVNVWLDEANLVPGVNWEQPIRQQISEADILLVLVGRERSSRSQEPEISEFMRRSVRAPNLRIVPVLLQGGDIRNLPPALQHYQTVDLREITDPVSQFSRLAAALAIDSQTGEAANDEEIGDRLRVSGEPQAALPYYEKAMKVALARFGEAHPTVAAIRAKMGNLLLELGDLSSAKNHFELALSVNDAAYGPDDPIVGASINDLATVHDRLGNYAEAEDLYRRSLLIKEKALGHDHIDVATTLNDMGALYSRQGRYAEAEQLLERALAIWEKALGSGHSKVASALNNLASLYNSEGNYPKAESLLEEALATRERVLGPDHPEVAISMNNLAEVYHSQGRYAEAEPLLQRALAISERTLGPESPRVASSLNNLAQLHQSQGKYSQAEPLLQRALAIQEKILGSEHPDVALSLNNLALLYDHQGRYPEAEPLYRRALEIDEKMLGPEHPGLATNLNNLAALYHNEGRYAEAEPLLERALAILEKAMGLNHPDVPQTRNNLASLYKSQGKHEEATVLLLTYPQCLRLKLYAEELITALGQKTLGRGYADLLREAATAIVTGLGAWKEGTDFYQDLPSAMRKVAMTWKEEAERLQQRVWEAALSLPAARLLRLKRYAKWRIRGIPGRTLGREEQDLIEEALIATAEGRRVWKEGVDFFQHLQGAIRSISTSWREKAVEEYLESELTHPGDVTTPLERPAMSADPERTLEAKEKLEQVRNLFANDATASQVIELLGLEYTGKEIQSQLGISEREFGAAAKRIRRKLDLWSASQHSL